MKTAPKAHPLRIRSILRNGAILGVVFFVHIALVVGLLASWTLGEARIAAAPDARDRVLQVSVDERPHLTAPAPLRHVPEPLQRIERVRRVARAAASTLAPLPIMRTARSPESKATVPAVADAPASAQADAPVALLPSAPAYTGGDPALMQALETSARRSPVGVPGFDAGSRVQGVVLAAPSSLKDSFNAVGHTLNCNAIKMQRNKAGNQMSAELDKAYDEMGCTG
jgi:hypothetical protein